MASVIFAPSSPVASLYGARHAPGATAFIIIACGYLPLPRSLGREEEKHLPATTSVVSHFRWVFFFFASLSGTTRSMASNFEKVKIERNGDRKIEFDGYVVGEKGAPGIVVVQEWWGVDYEIKKHAINIASKGYRALIPESQLHCFFFSINLNEYMIPQALQSLCVVGQGAEKYGFWKVLGQKLSKLTAKALEEKLRKANVPSEVYLYPNVGHAFMNSSPEAIERKKATDFGEHHQEAVDLAWSRFDLWFKKYLQVGK
ncbi:unnamed protein product [Sphagnum balticum]